MQDRVARELPEGLPWQLRKTVPRNDQKLTAEDLKDMSDSENGQPVLQRVQADSDSSFKGEKDGEDDTTSEEFEEEEDPEECSIVCVSSCREPEPPYIKERHPEKKREQPPDATVNTPKRAKKRTKGQ